MMRFAGQSPDEIALKLADIAWEAGRVLRSMENAFIDKRIKSDGSPTTAADLAAEELIIKRLDEAWSGVPVVAEETCSSAETEDYFFLVDPLDGTGDFIHGTGEYSVNIALIHGDRPLAAVVAAPAMGSIWIAGDDRPRERAPGRFGGGLRMARGEGSAGPRDGSGGPGEPSAWGHRH